MVCDSCQTKLSRVIVPDKWKDGARNAGFGAVKAGKTNKALAAKKTAAQWIPSDNNCRLCRSKTMKDMHYCNDCAYKKGICTMCGKKVADVSGHKMTLV